MTVLDRLVFELEATKGPILLTELGRRLGVQPSALRGMIDVLASKDAITVPAAASGAGAFACGAACGARCVGVEACTFVADVGIAFPMVAKGR